MDTAIAIFIVAWALVVIGGTLYGITIGIRLMVEAIRNHRKETK